MADDEKKRQQLVKAKEQWMDQQQSLEKKRKEQEQLRIKLHQDQQQLTEMQARIQQQQQALAQQQQPPSGSTLEMLNRQVQNINFFSTIGSLAEFKIGDDWDLYQERLVQYFVANQVALERRVAVLITLIGQDAYTILKDLCDPVLPEAKPLII